MQEKLDKIEEIIKESMQKMNISIVSIDYVTENKYHFLKIVLDRINGIDLDTIVEATNIINPLLDKHDLIKEKYILDISSKERG